TAPVANRVAEVWFGLMSDVGSERSNGAATDVAPAPLPITDELPIVRPMAAAVPESAPPPRSPWRWVAYALAAVLLLGVAYYAFSLWQVWSTGRADEARPVDAVVVMGAAQYDGRPSPQLAARLDHVVELWPQGFADTVVVTGGKQPADRFTEAEASAAYLIERGVPEEAIVLENEGSSTIESLDGVAELLPDDASVLIVTDPYHSLRAKLVAEDAGLEAYVSSTPTSVVTGSSSLQRHLREAAGVAAGRLIGFDRLSGVSG
ncbi:MAG: YdcF family protein, partial [Actinomycetota bacterium]